MAGSRAAPRSATATRTPSAARARAMPRPIPRAAPVTRATLPLSSMRFLVPSAGRAVNGVAAAADPSALQLRPQRFVEAVGEVRGGDAQGELGWRLGAGSRAPLRPGDPGYARRSDDRPSP